MPAYTEIISFLIGIVLLLWGRRLFWVFVGAVGFFAGFEAAGSAFAGQGEGAALTMGLFCGAAGIVLALVFQRLAIILAGAAGGGVLCANILLAFVPGAADLMTGIVFLLGAVIGGVLVNFAFGAALIFLSSAIGAMIIANSLPFEETVRYAAFLAAVVTGLLVQSRQVTEAPAVDEGEKSS